MNLFDAFALSRLRAAWRVVVDFDEPSFAQWQGPDSWHAFDDWEPFRPIDPISLVGRLERDEPGLAD